MTILAGARNSEAVVIGSDSQESTPSGKRKTTKLWESQSGLLIAWAGNKDVAQALSLSLRDNPVDLSKKRSQAADEIKERFRGIRQQPDLKHLDNPSEFMFGWYCTDERKPVGLHVFSQGRSPWIENWEFAGSPAATQTARAVEASLGYLDTSLLTPEQLSLVVLKVITDTVDAAPPTAMVGGEAQLAVVTASGVDIKKATDLRAQHDTLDVWLAQCADLLPGATAKPKTKAKVDHGLRPPR